MERLREAVEGLVGRVVGRRDSAVVSTVLTCLEKGHDRKEATKLLSSKLHGGGGDVAELVEQLVVLREQFNKVLPPPARKRKSILDTEVKEEHKKMKVSSNGGGADVNDKLPSTLAELHANKIRETMENAQKEIQERKLQLNLQPAQGQLNNNSNNNNREHAEMLRKAAELQAKIQMKLASAGFTAAPVVATGPTPLILDELGRTIDVKTGQLVRLEQHTPTLKANIRAKKREHFRAVQDKPSDTISQTAAFFDPRLKPKPQVRSRKTFKFYEEGKFQMIGQKIRTKVLLDKLQEEIAVGAKKTGIASAAKLAIIQPRKEEMDEVPCVEWWDSVVLQSDIAYPEDKDTAVTSFEGITHLVEHPIQMKPPVEDAKGAPLKVMLTREERRKLRRQARNEVQKEIQEKIKLGLINPPEPKVKLANLMRVLGSDAVQNPTKVEAHVRSQMAKRQKAHQEANQSRKLTKAQRREKRMKKLREDTSSAVVVSVYRVKDLSHPSHKFKVEMNANQLFMTGIIILHKDCNVIVVEGGPKQTKKFQRLVSERIKWNKKDKMKAGTVKQRSFKEIRFKTCPTEAYAREQLKKHKCQHYWDLAFSSTILESTSKQTL